MFFWNDEKIEVVYADKKPFVACSNFFEAKFDSGEVGPVEVAVKPNEEKTEVIRKGKSKKSQLTLKSEWKQFAKDSDGHCCSKGQRVVQSILSPLPRRVEKQRTTIEWRQWRLPFEG